MIKETKSLFLGITVPGTDGFGTHGQKTMHEMGFLQLQRESSCQEGTLGHRIGDTLGETESWEDRATAERSSVVSRYLRWPYHRHIPNPQAEEATPEAIARPSQSSGSDSVSRQLPCALAQSTTTLRWIYNSRCEKAPTGKRGSLGTESPWPLPSSCLDFDSVTRYAPLSTWPLVSSSLKWEWR